MPFIKCESRATKYYLYLCLIELYFVTLPLTIKIVLTDVFDSDEGRTKTEIHYVRICTHEISHTYLVISLRLIFRQSDSCDSCSTLSIF